MHMLFQTTVSLKTKKKFSRKFSRKSCLLFQYYESKWGQEMSSSKLIKKLHKGTQKCSIWLICSKLLIDIYIYQLNVFRCTMWLNLSLTFLSTGDKPKQRKEDTTREVEQFIFISVHPIPGSLRERKGGKREHYPLYSGLKRPCDWPYYFLDCVILMWQVLVSDDVE